MRSYAAPAGRGSGNPSSRWRTRSSGFAALLYLTLATTVPSALADPSGLAGMPEASAPRRQLQTASGQAAPALTLTDLHGLGHDLEQSAGKIVLVHFFATWCEPCRPELASLSKLIAQNGDTLAAFAVSVAEPPVRVRRFFEKNPVNFPVLPDADRAVTKAWSVSVLPTTFVLDPTGAIRLHVEGDMDWLRPDVLARLEELKRPLPFDHH